MASKTYDIDGDRMGTKCQQKRCSGDYKETSQHDDMYGDLHCSKCGHGVKRWPEDDAKTEGYVKKYRRKPLHRKMIRKKSLLRNGTELRSFSDFLPEAVSDFEELKRNGYKYVGSEPSSDSSVDYFQHETSGHPIRRVVSDLNGSVKIQTKQPIGGRVITHPDVASAVRHGKKF